MSQVVNSSSCSMRSNLILIVVVNGAWLVHWAHLIGNVGSLICCLSNWKFIASSKLLTGFMVPSKTSLMGSAPFCSNFPLACTQIQFDQFIELSLLSDLSVIKISQERSTLHIMLSFLSLFCSLSISLSASISFYIAISLALPLSLSSDQRELSSSVYRAGGYTSNG